ncbi:hypothetical protein M758_12G043000, partial [Ceratodon purpureus]
VLKPNLTNLRKIHFLLSLALTCTFSGFQKLNIEDIAMEENLGDPVNSRGNPITKPLMFISSTWLSRRLMLFSICCCFSPVHHTTLNHRAQNSVRSQNLDLRPKQDPEAKSST